MIMASERYEIRLDTEHKRRLRELSAAYGVPGSQVVKDLIDKALMTGARQRGCAR
jgi:predicted DNA-binding protein